MKLLSHAMDYWSNGSQKAIFLNHEVSYTPHILNIIYES